MRYKKITICLIAIIGCFMTAEVVSAYTVTTLAIREKAGQTSTNYPLTFGQIFKKGEITQGIQIKYNNQLIPAQFDIKRRYDDNSIKHGVISVILPSVPANQDTPLEILSSSQPNSETGYLTKDQILQTDIESQINLANLSGGGAANGYAGNKTASLRQAVQDSPTLSYWLKGPIVTEILIRQDIPDQANRNQLNGYWEARIYNTGDIRIANSVENVNSSARANVTYDLDIELGHLSPISKYSKTALTQYADTRWRKVFWQTSEPSEIEVRYDNRYLIDTGLIPSYDTSLQVAEQTLSKDCTSGPEQGSVGYACWKTKNTDIDGSGFLTKYFPGTGGRPEIGILPKWDALYWLTSDNRMREISLTTSEISGMIPIHIRDSATGKPISIDTYPSSRLSSSWPPPIGTISGSGWTVDRSHQGAFNYTAYIVTGERWHLEEIYYWANWNMIDMTPGSKTAGTSRTVYRGEEKGLISDQIRGEGWAVRIIGMAGALASDSDPWEKSYFTEKTQNNIDWWNGTLAGVSQQHMQNSMPLHSWGWAPWNSGGKEVFDIDEGWNVSFISSWWMEDFCAVSVRMLADLGFRDVSTTLSRFGSFVIGRFTNHDGWNAYDGASYQSPAVIFTEKLEPARWNSSTITFSAASNTITDPNADFVSQGFKTGDKIEVFFAVNDANKTDEYNDGPLPDTFTLTGVTPTQLSISSSLADESPRPAYPVASPVWNSSGGYVSKTGYDFVGAGFKNGMTIKISGSNGNDGMWIVSNLSATAIYLEAGSREIIGGNDPGTVTFTPQIAIELDRTRPAVPVSTWSEMKKYLHSTKTSFTAPDYPYSYRFQGLAAVASVAEYVSGGINTYRWLSNTDGDGINNGVDVTGQSRLAADPTWALVPRSDTPAVSPKKYVLSDFINLVVDWLKIGPSTADLNDDGRINSMDLGIMMGSWE